MWKIQEGFTSLLLKLGRAIAKSEDTTEKPAAKVADESTEPETVYWYKDMKRLDSENKPFIDQFLQKEDTLNRIPDEIVEDTDESRYEFENLLLNLDHLPELVKNSYPDIPEPPKDITGISSSGRDAGVVAGIVVAVISGVIILAGLIAVVMYRHYVHRNVTSMNFDNPVYRKTTEDQFALEKNGYAPGSKLYPSTVGEEAREPLNTPNTNDFV